MATNFPASLDSLTNPAAGDSLSSPSHSAQHANVNDAVEALQAKVGVDGSAVTSSLDYKVANQGLTLVKSQTIGSGVSSVTVSDAFSSTFDNYRIVYTDISCSATDNVMFMRLDNHTSSTYSLALAYFTYTGTSGTYEFASSNLGLGLGGSGVDASGACDLFNPFLAKVKRAAAIYNTDDVGGIVQSKDTSATSRTGFTFRVGTGTMTGGTIRVYGYNNG